MIAKPEVRLTGVDDVTRRVHDMYSRFPYPSLEPREQRLKELANLLRLFAAEVPFDFRGKRVLDVGTGTGHRLIAAARRFPDTHFTAIDLCAAPLEIARATATEAGVSNVTFQQHDVMDGSVDLGRFDVVLCMGVLHHLADPALGLRRMTRFMADDGVLLTYLYGSLGSAERMRRKEMLALLLGADEGRFDAGIEMAKALNFAAEGFGWNRNADDTSSLDALIVDSYMNVNETLFDIAGIAATMRLSGLDSFMPFGITTESRGYLFDTAIDAPTPMMVEWTDMRKFLPAPAAVSAYNRLGLRERCRLVELAYQPNGYTVLACKRAAEHRFAPGGRVRRNSLAV